MATAKCTSIQKSLGWCQGTPELPGVKRRIYFLAKSFILGYPQLPRDELGRATSAILTGEFTLAADAKRKYIDILPDKSQLTSEAQGELPSQTQLNQLVAVHHGHSQICNDKVDVISVDFIPSLFSVISRQDIIGFQSKSFFKTADDVFFIIHN